MVQIVIGGYLYEVQASIYGFDIRTKPSSNVAFYGTCTDGRLFVQFKNGVSYLYSDVDHGTLTDLEDAESIGKFINIRIVPRFPAQKVLYPLVKRAEPTITSIGSRGFVAYFHHRQDIVGTGITETDALQSLRTKFDVTIENEEYLRKKQAS